MISERELTGLLHRADWTRLSLSGTVRGAEPPVDSAFIRQGPPPAGWPPRRGDDPQPPLPPHWNFAPGEGEGAEWSLAVAPGRRYRVESADGSHVAGCDGERTWQWSRELPADVSVGFDGRPRPPFPVLLAPAWLVTGYALTLDSEVTACGRTGVRVLGTPRAVLERTRRVGGRLGRGSSSQALFSPVPRWLGAERWDEVDAVVDVELGILLRCSRRSGDDLPAVTEFGTLDLGEQGGAARFSAPAGSVFGGDGLWATSPRERPAGATAGTSRTDALGQALGTAGKEAAKTVAGMAAGGLGALIRYAPARRADPFARATTEDADPEPRMPGDEPAPDGQDDGTAPAPWREAPPDEVLHLVYQGGLAAPRFSASLHQWVDFGALLAAVPRSARDAGFGGVGFLVDAMRDRAQETGAGTGHTVSTVRMGGWGEYRIDVVRSLGDANPGRRGQRGEREPLTVAADGARQWQVFADRVVTGAAAPVPGEVADLVDASWLLDCDLSGGAEAWAAGRRGYRIVARRRECGESGWDWLARMYFPAVAVVDAETGWLLRLTRFKGELPVLRQELRDVAEPDGADGFGFVPPPGLPVHDADAQRNAGRPRRAPSQSWPWDEPPR